MRNQQWNALTEEETVAALMDYCMDFRLIWQWARVMEREQFRYLLNHWIAYSPFGMVPVAYCDRVYDAMKEP